MGDKQKLKLWCQSPLYVKHATQEFFSQYDANENGTIEWDEAAELVQAMHASAGVPAPTSQEVFSAFYAMDTNLDEKISQEVCLCFHACILVLSRSMMQSMEICCIL